MSHRRLDYCVQSGSHWWCRTSLNVYQSYVFCTTNVFATKVLLLVTKWAIYIYRTITDLPRHTHTQQQQQQQQQQKGGVGLQSNTPHFIYSNIYAGSCFEHDMMSAFGLKMNPDTVFTIKQ